MTPNNFIAGNISKLALALYILNDIWIGIFIAICVHIGSTFQMHPPLVVLLEIGVTLLGIDLLYGFLGLWRLPFKTVMRDSTLTTYSVLGKRTLNLNELVAAKRVRFWSGAKAGLEIYAVKLITPGNALYLHLGSMPNAQREAMFAALKPYVLNQNVRQENDSEGTFRKWQRP